MFHFSSQNEKAIDLTIGKWWVEQKVKFHLLELPKQLIGFNVKTICFLNKIFMVDSVFTDSEKAFLTKWVP